MEKYDLILRCVMMAGGFVTIAAAAYAYTRREGLLFPGVLLLIAYIALSASGAY